MKTNFDFKTESGFTLIEILIASYVFLLVVLAGTIIFSSAVGAKMKASAFWETQQDTRYIMEKITRTIKSENIKGFKITNNNQGLWLCDSANCPSGAPLYRFYLKNSEKSIYFGEGTAVETKLSSSNIEVTDLRFGPSFSVENNQPYLTIKLTVRNKAGKKIEEDTLTLRTAVSLRNYSN